MASGEVAVLNVGAGDLKLSFDRNNPSECIRAARIVKDMLRRGYALLVEVERNGVKAFERVLEFREDTYEYLIADFDPVEAYQARKREREAEKAGEQAHGEIPATETRESKTPGGDEKGPGDQRTPRRGRPRKTLDAGTTRAVAVGRSAGG